MKSLGQHIVNFIARFKSSVYFKSVENASTDTDKFLVIGSSGKLKYRTGDEVASDIGASGDITSVGITTDSGAGSPALVSSGAADFRLLGSNGVGITNSGVTITARAEPGEIDHDSLNNYEETKHFTQGDITTVGTIGTGVWQGTAINQTYLNGQSGTNTGDETKSSIEGLGITVVGTVSEGTWQGTAIASAYLDADTAHISATKEVTHHNYKADQGTTETYVGLADADSEGTSTTNIDMPLTALAAGKLLKVFLRSNKNINGHTLTFRLRTISSGATMTSTPAIIGAQSGAGCQNSTMTTYDFTTGLNSEGAETNAIAAGDAVYLTLESNTDFGNNVQYYITCMWEWNLS